MDFFPVGVYIYTNLGVSTCDKENITLPESVYCLFSVCDRGEVSLFECQAYGGLERPSCVYVRVCGGGCCGVLWEFECVFL